MSARVLADAPWRADAAAQRVLALLNGDGEEARVIGGAVRNALLKLPVGDLDIATTAVPDEVMRRAAAAHVKAVPTGIAHGTVTLVAGGTPFEVTTLRRDVLTFGRKAEVAFGRDWAADAQRRDFTVNGLSVSADGVIHDHVGGLADIAARRVRFIGDPDTRIAEDYLRILRFFRIHAGYGQGAPDRAGLAACIRGRGGLASLSAERVRMELLKLLLAGGAVDATAAMADAGLLVLLLSGVPYSRAFAAMVSLERALGVTPDAVRRLGALGVAIGEDAARLAARLRLTRAEAKQLAAMAEAWWGMPPSGEADARRALYRLGAAVYRDRLLLAAARCHADAASVRGWLALSDTWTAPTFPLKAADFIARGIAAGPALGIALAKAEQLWLDAEMPADASVIADAVVREL